MPMPRLVMQMTMMLTCEWLVGDALLALVRRKAPWHTMCAFELERWPQTVRCNGDHSGVSVAPSVTVVCAADVLMCDCNRCGLGVGN